MTTTGVINDVSLDVAADLAAQLRVDSIRSSTSDPFPPGTRMPTLVQTLAQYVTGFTVDRKAIFVEDSTVFATAVLTRENLSLPFTNPNESGPPPQLPGLRMRSANGCTQLIGSAGGGCSNELIYEWTAQ